MKGQLIPLYVKRKVTRTVLIVQYLCINMHLAQCGILAANEPISLRLDVKPVFL